MNDELKEAHHDRDRYHRDAAYWREECEGLAEVLQQIGESESCLTMQSLAREALARHAGRLIDGGGDRD